MKSKQLNLSYLGGSESYDSPVCKVVFLSPANVIAASVRSYEYEDNESVNSYDLDW